MQRAAREVGNSVFVDRKGLAYTDQWAFLASVSRQSAAETERLVRAASAEGAMLGVRSASDDEEDDPWTLPPSGRPPERPIRGPLPQSLKVVQANMLFVDKSDVPPVLLSRVARLAAFANQEFRRAQAMRLSTRGKPRVIACAVDYPRHIGLPRGTVGDLRDLLARNGVQLELRDERCPGAPINATFHGALSAEQQAAAEAMLGHDTGVLAAATGFGKTVIGAYLVAQRGVNTLVIVHRRQILDQWQQQLGTLLVLPKGDLGLFGGGRHRPSGKVDIALFQSLARQGDVADLVANYGQVIVDECHHVPAVSFEQVLRRVRARYVVGLTATPVRKDGHHPIIIMHCGPIRFRTGPKTVRDVLLYEVVARVTSFAPPAEMRDVGIQNLYGLLSRDVARNEMIVAHVLEAVEAGRSPPSS